MTKILSFSLLFLFLFSCKQKVDEIPETATSGILKIAFDESYLPLVRQEIDIFHYLYKYATVLDTVVSQEKSHELFLKDSVKLIFSSRNLNSNEIAYLKAKKVFPKIYEFAQDGLVLIVHPASKDSVFKIHTLSNLVSVENSKAILVVDNASGASITSFAELVGIPKERIKNVFSAENTLGVIDYVSKNTNAIGLIASEWISDTDNPKVQEVLKQVKIAKLLGPKSDEAFGPFQSEIADSLYPFKRKLYIISRETKMGIANGFASFLLGEKGQRVVLKSGTLPIKVPSREVVISKKSVY